MPITDQNQAVAPRALICVDSFETSAGAIGHVFGQPTLLYQVRQLHKAGISVVGVAVTNVPPEFPVLVEKLHAEGIEVRLLRSGVDLAGFADEAASSGILVQDASVWAEEETITRLIAQQRNTLAVLTEMPSSALFERIDLNRRWAGLLFADPKLLRECGEIPEGWSLASFLLRSALQAGYADFGVETDATMPVLHATSPDFTRAVEQKVSAKQSNSGVIDTALHRFLSFALARLGHNDWYRPLVKLAFPALSGATLGAALFSFDTTMYALMLLTILAYFGREHLGRVEMGGYRQDHLTKTGISALFVSTAISLSTEIGWGDAAFLTIVAAGLFWLTLARPITTLSRQFSPIMLGVILLAGKISGHSVWAAKLVIILLLLVVALRPRLNPN